MLFSESQTVYTTLASGKSDFGKQCLCSRQLQLALTLLLS